MKRLWPLFLICLLTLGLNINPSDADSPETPQKLMMSTSAIRLRTDPTTFGKVTLV